MVDIAGLRLHGRIDLLAYRMLSNGFQHFRQCKFIHSCTFGIPLESSMPMRGFHSVSPDPRISTGTGQVTINGDTSVAINKDFLMDNTGASGLELEFLRDQSLFVRKGQQATCLEIHGSGFCSWMDVRWWSPWFDEKWQCRGNLDFK